METSSTELQRLDFAAQLLCADSYASRGRLALTGLAIFVCFLAWVSEAPSPETNLIRVLAGVALVSVA